MTSTTTATTISTEGLTWVPATRTFVTEASDLARLAGIGAYVNLVSHKTGRVMKLRFFDTDFNDEGEQVSWTWMPESYEDRALVKALVVYND